MRTRSISTNPANQIYKNKSGDNLPYKICPETDAEEVVYVADQEKSIIEVMGRHEDALWKDRVAAFKSWYKLLLKGKAELGRQRSRQCRWNWKCSRTQRTGEKLQREEGAPGARSQNISNGETLEKPTSKTPSSSRRLQAALVESTRMSASTQQKQPQNIRYGFNSSSRM